MNVGFILFGGLCPIVLGQRMVFFDIWLLYIVEMSLVYSVDFFARASCVGVLACYA